MKNLNKYIFEKLSINKDTKIVAPSEEDFMAKFKEFNDRLDRTKINNLNLSKIWPDVWDKARPRIERIGTLTRIWLKDDELRCTAGAGARDFKYDELTDSQKLAIFDYMDSRLKENKPITEKLRINKDTELSEKSSNNELTDKVITFLLNRVPNLEKNENIDGFKNSLNIFFNEHSNIKDLFVFMGQNDFDEMNLNGNWPFEVSADGWSYNRCSKLFKNTSFYHKGLEILKSDWGVDIKYLGHIYSPIYFIDKEKSSAVPRL